MTSKYRRTISMSPQTYVRMRSFCNKQDRPLAQVLELVLNRYLDEVNEPLPSLETAKNELSKRPRYVRGAKRNQWEVASGIFTF